MPKYVCNLTGDSNWHKTKSEVEARTFDTELEAKEWFQKQCPDGKVEFTEFQRTQRFMTSWVDCNNKSLGEINKIPNSGEKFFTS
ncbi:hypothetical protein ACE1AT_21945 [Pelatocladus sp. BLCC-F211]|uniref:hypothetical protein n=1 Tax=Pelatocladus sp. BLCC-F211 TaxID=3342752 RepID=UPI0035B86A14